MSNSSSQSDKAAPENKQPSESKTERAVPSPDQETAKLLMDSVHEARTEKPTIKLYGHIIHSEFPPPQKHHDKEHKNELKMPYPSAHVSRDSNGNMKHIDIKSKKDH